MFRLPFVFFVLFHLSVKAQTEIIDLFDLRSEISDSLRAESFANWFCNATFTTDLLQSFDIPLAPLGKAVGLSQSDISIEAIYQELVFYKEQGPAFKDGFIKFIRTIYPNVLAGFNKKMDQTDIDVIIFRLADSNQLLLGARAKKGVKAKMLNLLFHPSCKPIGNLIFHTRKGKFRKQKLPEEFAFQQYTRTDTATDLKLDINEISYSISLKPITHPLPFIKKYIASSYTIEEGEKITFTWDVLGAKEVWLDNGIGKKAGKWQLNISPLDTAIYTLTAMNDLGTSTESITINVIQTKLVNSKLTFFCPEAGDPKKAGSTIVFKMMDMYDKEVARFEGGSEFEMNGKTPYYGPFTLTWNEAIYKKQLRRGQLVIEIQGSENDTWTFSPILLLNYSDGTKKELYGFGNKVVETGKAGVVIEF